MVPGPHGVAYESVFFPIAFLETLFHQCPQKHPNVLIKHLQLNYPLKDHQQSLKSTRAHRPKPLLVCSLI